MVPAPRCRCLLMPPLAMQWSHKQITANADHSTGWRDARTFAQTLFAALQPSLLAAALLLDTIAGREGRWSHRVHCGAAGVMGCLAPCLFSVLVALRVALQPHRVGGMDPTGDNNAAP
ncbi:hypothetical protein B0O80DRAFT_453166 [Mortierella sp. GBAus27b]|nr:hypothetical protein B0O80DRAFT_453166 [Mortierella sp. GBAus27b]